MTGGTLGVVSRPLYRTRVDASYRMLSLFCLLASCIPYIAIERSPKHTASPDSVLVSWAPVLYKSAQINAESLRDTVDSVGTCCTILLRIEMCLWGLHGTWRPIESLHVVAETELFAGSV